MKEVLRRIVTHGYLREHPVENLYVASLIRVAEKRKQGPFSEMEGYPKLLLQRFHEADSRFSEVLYAPIDIRSFLELANQMYAIEQLGKSHDNKALDYLRFLSEERVKIVRKSVGYYISPDTISHEWTQQEHLYPNARGELRCKLNFNIRITTTDDWGDEYSVPPEKMQSELERVKQLPSHQILNIAIATLEQDLASR